MSEDDQFDSIARCIMSLKNLAPEEIAKSIRFLRFHFRREIMAQESDRLGAMRRVLDEGREFRSYNDPQIVEGLLMCAESPIEQMVLLAMATERWMAVRNETGITRIVANDALGVRIQRWAPGFQYARALMIVGHDAKAARERVDGPLLGNAEQPTIAFALVQPEIVGDDIVRRMDLALVLPNTKQLVDIELDGHDFHERTKEQSQRDKSGDRALTLDGWTVLRFTGSEIFADPWIVTDAIDRLRENKGAHEKETEEAATEEDDEVPIG